MPKVYSNLKINSLRQKPRKSAMAIDLEGYVVKGDVFDIRKVPTLSLLDKNIPARNTVGDSQIASNYQISEVPVNNSYIDVKVNGISYEVGNGNKLRPFYFSSDGGSTAKSFNSNGANGKITKGDSLYWNGTIAGFDLKSTWSISIHYLRNYYDQIEFEVV